MVSPTEMSPPVSKEQRVWIRWLHGECLLPLEHVADVLGLDLAAVAVYVAWKPRNGGNGRRPQGPPRYKRSVRGRRGIAILGQTGSKIRRLCAGLPADRYFACPGDRRRRRAGLRSTARADPPRPIITTTRSHSADTDTDAAPAFRAAVPRADRAGVAMASSSHRRRPAGRGPVPLQAGARTESLCSRATDPNMR